MLPPTPAVRPKGDESTVDILPQLSELGAAACCEYALSQMLHRGISNPPPVHLPRSIIPRASLAVVTALVCNPHGPLGILLAASCAIAAVSLSLADAFSTPEHCRIVEAEVQNGNEKRQIVAETRRGNRSGKKRVNANFRNYFVHT